MNFTSSCNYEKIQQRQIASGLVDTWISRNKEDTCWDSFLQETPLGQFQQSAVWAQTKDVEGWKPIRVILTIEGKKVGGFQILWRSSWGIRIGYVSKGPVVLPDYLGLGEYVTELLRKLSQSNRLKILLVQPPDLCEQMSMKLTDGGYMFNVLTGVNEATWIVDLRDGFQPVEKKMRSDTRRKARQAVERGITIREGEREDIGTFFELMLATCRRQGVKPNPSDVRTLFRLWDAGQAIGIVRITFAEWEGKPVSGQFDICFGDTVTLWKKGWNSTEPKRFPNDYDYTSIVKVGFFKRL